MAVMTMIVKSIVGMGILNVWLLRRNQVSPYRGGQAKNMAEEFATYGLPHWAVPVVGTFKVGLALLILGSFFVPSLVTYGAIGLGLFMLAAVLMHIKVRDSLQKTMPALLMLIMCCYLAYAGNVELLDIARN